MIVPVIFNVLFQLTKLILSGNTLTDTPTGVQYSLIDTHTGVHYSLTDIPTGVHYTQHTQVCLPHRHPQVCITLSQTPTDIH